MPSTLFRYLAMVHMWKVSLVRRVYTELDNRKNNVESNITIRYRDEIPNIFPATYYYYAFSLTSSQNTRNRQSKNKLLLSHHCVAEYFSTGITIFLIIFRLHVTTTLSI